MRYARTSSPSIVSRGPSLALILGLALVVPQLGLSDPGQKPLQMRDSAGHRELASAFTQAQRQDPMRLLPPKPPRQDGKTASSSQSKDLLRSSDLLCHRGMATLIPKKALLHLPVRYADRTEYQSQAKMVTFQQFAKYNRVWLKTVEVTLDQAAGRAALDEQLLLQIQRSSLVTVATYQGGPISVLPSTAP